MISSDEAFLMLNKWRDAEHPLKLLIAGEGFRISFGGLIHEVAGSRLTFFPLEPNVSEGEAILETADCEFEYGDSREAPSGSVSSLKFSSILTIIRPDGTHFMFAEFRL